jgi:hypothetical protein
VVFGVFRVLEVRGVLSDTLEQERLKKQGADIRAMWSLRTPRTSRTLKTPKTTPNGRGRWGRETLGSPLYRVALCFLTFET